MNIDLEFYRVFCKVAEKGSISKAAEELYISQPAITQTIKKLEDLLGGTLFYRKNNGVELTKEGKQLYDYIKDSIEIAEGANKKFEQYKNIEDGSIKIKTGNNNARRILLKPLIKFAKDYSNIKIEISTGNLDESMSSLSLGNIDIVILNIPYKNSYNNVQIEEIKKNEYIFVMSKEYAQKNNVNIKEISDLNNYTLIIPKENTTSRNIFNEYIQGISLKCKYEVAQEEIRKDLAVSNVGIAYVMEYLVDEELNNGDLIKIKLPKKNIESKIGIATLRENIASFATRKLVEYIKKEND